MSPARPIKVAINCHVMQKGVNKTKRKKRNEVIDNGGVL